MDKPTVLQEFVEQVKGMDLNDLELRMLTLIEQRRGKIISLMGVPPSLIGKLPPGSYSIKGVNADVLIIDDLSNFDLSMTEPTQYAIKRMTDVFELKARGIFDPIVTNRKPDGWYRMFEKPNGKRNKKL